MSTEQELDQIEDPGEFNQRWRIRAINESIQRVFNQRRHGLDKLYHGAITRQQYQTILREAVESLIIWVEQPLQNYDDDDDEAKHYWKDISLGTVSIPPNGESYEFKGLESILEFDDPLVVTWEVVTEPPAGFSSAPGGHTETRQEKVQIPEDVLMKAARETMNFLSTVGLGLGLEDQTPQDRAEHSDLRGLLTLRGQDEVAEELPGDDDE